MKKAGFTIVELMTVIAIIAILAGLVTSAASAAIRQSRKSRSSAMQSVLQNGISAYYAHTGKWPGSSLDDYAEKGEGGKTQHEKESGYVTLSDTEAQQTFRKVVKESIASATPYLDATGLFVSPKANPSTQGDGELTPSKDLRYSGMSFRDAVRKTERHATALKPDQLYYGYPDARTGKFRQFRLRYNFRGDTVQLLK